MRILVMRCLAKDDQSRPSVRECAHRLKALASGADALSAGPTHLPVQPGVEEPEEAPPSRNWLATVANLLCLAALLAGAFGLVRFLQRPASLVVRVSESNAAITVKRKKTSWVTNFSQVETNGVILEQLPPDEYVIEVCKDGFEPAPKTVEVKPRRRSEVSLVLKSAAVAPRLGAVRLTILHRQGVELVLASQVRQWQTNVFQPTGGLVLTNLIPELHSLVATSAGYAAFHTSVQVVADATTDIQVPVLPRLTGTMALSALSLRGLTSRAADCEVLSLIEDEPFTRRLALTERPTTLPNLPTGRYRVTAHSGGGSSTEWIVPALVHVPAHATTNVVIPFERRPLLLYWQPADAEVFVDGELWKDTYPIDGEATGKKYVKTGLHEVRVRRAGYHAQVTNLMVWHSTTNRFLLERSRWPFPREPWTNSLNMEFAWIEPRGGAGFWIGAKETTVWQFTQFERFAQGPAFKDVAQRAAQAGMISVTKAGWTNVGYSWKNPGPGWNQTDEHPVVGISWEDAHAFCQWLTAWEQEKMDEPPGKALRRNQRYRLPTDAEWSLAAGDTVFPWGNDFASCIQPAGNFAGLEVTTNDWPAQWHTLATRFGGYHDRFTRTAPVGQFAANPWGLYDLAGNVAEWCADGYDVHGNAALRASQPFWPDEPEATRYRILRGGSWFDDHEADLRTSARHRARPEERHDRYGLRVVLIEEEEAKP
jgi:formylglycine-generating enzyme required for sulfatase activity